MQYKKQLITILSFFFILACEKELKTSFTEVNLTTANNKLVEINIPKAEGDNIISKEINTVINKLVVYQLHVGDTDTITAKTIEESITSFNNEFNTFNTDFPDNNLPWEAQIDGEILFQSSEIISIAITSYVNTGGAHGNTNISFINFDATTGKRITNEKLIKNEVAFKDAAKPYFKAALKSKDILFEAENFILPTNIAYNNAGVILLYNTYEIEPYSTGIIDFTIPFEKVSSFLVFDGSK